MAMSAKAAFARSFCSGHRRLRLTSRQRVNVLFGETLPPSMDVGLVGAAMERPAKAWRPPETGSLAEGCRNGAS